MYRHVTSTLKKLFLSTRDLQEHGMIDLKASSHMPLSAERLKHDNMCEMIA
jgi:hypothetical protein